MGEFLIGLSDDVIPPGKKDAERLLGKLMGDGYEPYMVANAPAERVAGARPTWDETWLDVAAAIGPRSVCGRAQFGAVIVSKKNVQLASGYNGPPAGWPRTSDSCLDWCPRAIAAGDPAGPAPLGYDECLTVHAEANALLRCDWNAREGGTIYEVGRGAPCFSCAKLIANSGLARVVYRAGDDDYREPEKVSKFLIDCGLEVVRCT